MSINSKYNNKAERFLIRVRKAIKEIHIIMRDDSLNITYEYDDYVQEALRLNLYIESAINMARFTQSTREMMEDSKVNSMLEVSDQYAYGDLSERNDSKYKRYSEIVNNSYHLPVPFQEPVQ